jgi:hypothetical protein
MASALHFNLLQITSIGLLASTISRNMSSFSEDQSGRMASSDRVQRLAARLMVNGLSGGMQSSRRIPFASLPRFPPPPFILPLRSKRPVDASQGNAGVFP